MAKIAVYVGRGPRRGFRTSAGFYDRPHDERETLWAVTWEAAFLTA